MSCAVQKNYGIGCQSRMFLELGDVITFLSETRKLYCYWNIQFLQVLCVLFNTVALGVG